MFLFASTFVCQRAWPRARFRNAPCRRVTLDARGDSVSAGAEQPTRRPEAPAKRRGSRFLIKVRKSVRTTRKHGSVIPADVWLPPELTSDVLPCGDSKLLDNETHLPALVLNADYRPLSYLPLSLWSWQEAIKASLSGRVRVVAEYDKIIRAPSMSMRLPAVCLKRFQQSTVSRAAFTRFNVFLRDSFQCQYCGTSGPITDLTFDHVVPRSRGGKTCWRNVVTCCTACNRRKGGKLPHEIPNMTLQRQPYVPLYCELQEVARKFPPRFLHETWADYLFWDVPLQRDE
jgi:5-methylcytosine-specific restriction endonuclease McrA